MSSRPAHTSVKHSVSIAGHPTSISLEAPFWDELKRLAAQRGLSLAALIGEVDASRQQTNLSSALRLHVLAAVKREAQTARGD